MTRARDAISVTTFVSETYYFTREYLRVLVHPRSLAFVFRASCLVELPKEARMTFLRDPF